MLLLESTYGDRVHAPAPAEQLVRVIEETAHRGGALIAPAFAIDRAQELLWILHSLEQAGRLPLVSVHLDSPMAIDATDVYCRYPEEHDLEMQTLMDQERCPLRSRDLHRARTRDESKALVHRTGPMVVIAGSGMATGGRVLHHLARRLPDHLSARADQPETLRWLGGFVRPPAMTWLVHGEPDQAQALRQVLRDRLGWQVEVAADGASVALVARR